MTESDVHTAPAWMPKVIKESGISLTGSVVGVVLNYVVLATVTRFLSPHDYGTFTVAQSVIAVAMVLVLVGTPRALDRFIPEYVATGEPGKIRGLMVGVLRLVVALGLDVSFVLMALSRFLADTVFDNAGLLPVLRIMLLSIPALAWIELVAMSFAGFKELRYRVYTHQLALPVLKVVFALVLLTLGFGLLGWVWAYIAALLTASVIALALFRRRAWPYVSGSRAAPVDLRGIISYCWPLSVNNLVLLLSGHVGVLLLGAFRPESEAGVFRVYVYIVLLLAMVKTSFVQIYKPVAAEFAATGDRSATVDLHRRVSKWMLMAASFFGLVVLLAGEDILGVMVPASYRVSVSALLFLAAARTVSAGLGPQGMTLEAFGNTRFSMLNALLMLGVNVGLGRALIPDHGVLGAAVALGAGILVATAAELVEVGALHRLHPFGSRYVRALAVAAATGVVVYFLGSVLGEPGVVRALVITVSTAVLLGLGYRLTGALDRDDYAVLRAFGKRLPGAR